jgi:hypothetical protein
MTASHALSQLSYSPGGRDRSGQGPPKRRGIYHRHRVECKPVLMMPGRDWPAPGCSCRDLPRPHGHQYAWGAFDVKRVFSEKNYKDANTACVFITLYDTHMGKVINMLCDRRRLESFHPGWSSVWGGHARWHGAARPETKGSGTPPSSAVGEAGKVCICLQWQRARKGAWYQPRRSAVTRRRGRGYSLLSSFLRPVLSARCRCTANPLTPGAQGEPIGACRHGMNGA